jgi:UDP:flavonoid glycosyltransferase YjiC (YdhE family)
MKIPSERLIQSDQRALRTINAALQAVSARPLERLSDIFECSKHFLITFPELDHYGARDRSQYYGPILGWEAGLAPEWPQGQGPKVFAYLKPHYEHIEEMLGALTASECRIAAFVGGVPGKRLARLQNHTTSISQRPYDIKRAAAECDFCVCHGGHGTTCELLLMGKPLLLLPMQLEQYLMARRVSDAGAGVIADRDGPDGGFKAAVEKIINRPDLAKRAGEFASRYTGASSPSTVMRIADECETIVLRPSAATARRAKPNV